ncbi:MAG: hypothetical protein ACLPV8_25720 [Steroidobacteraceae bacterium]
MRYSNRTTANRVVEIALCSVLTCGAAGLAASALAAAPRPAVASTWQHHSVNFHYFGIVARFSCAGIEDHVRSLLLYFGARADLTVKANGCPHEIAPGRVASLDADFYTLAPAADASAPDAVQAHWSEVVVNPWRPIIMSDGDCELLAQMKDLIANNFTLRGLSYRTDCVPQEINGFSIKAQALKALPPPSTANAKG